MSAQHGGTTEAGMPRSGGCDDPGPVGTVSSAIVSGPRGATLKIEGGVGIAGSEGSTADVLPVGGLPAAIDDPLPMVVLAWPGPSVVSAGMPEMPVGAVAVVVILGSEARVGGVPPVELSIVEPRLPVPAVLDDGKAGVPVLAATAESSAVLVTAPPE